jgi:hypothetical protein
MTTPENASPRADHHAALPDARPATVTWLGYGGLLPFIALALATLIDEHHAALWCDALMAYGAVILSFVGALHWGLAMTLTALEARRRNARFAWSVVPALLAWSALLVAPAIASSLLVAGFIASYWQDTRLAGLARLPAWYLPLRLQLSGVACLSLAAGALVVSQ